MQLKYSVLQYVTVRGRGFDSQSGRYQVDSTRMCDCLQAGKPSQYITNRQGQLSLISLWTGVGKSSASVLLKLRLGGFTCVRCL